MATDFASALGQPVNSEEEEGRLSAFARGVRDAMRLALNRLPDRLPLFAAALIGGVLVAALAPYRNVAVTALVLSTTAMVVASLAFGVRTLRDDGTRSFLFSQPIRGGAIFWGEFISSLLTGAFLGGLVILPAWLRTWSDPVQAQDLNVFWMLLAVLPFSFLLTHALLGLAEASARWWIASIVLAAIAATTVGFVAGELAAWMAGRASEILILLVLIGIGLAAPLAAASRRAALGRTDRVACHRAFFRTYWVIVAVVLLLALGLFGAVATIEPGDLDPLVWQVSPDGRWVAMRAHVGEFAPGPLASLRRGASTQFLLDTERNEWTRLGDAAGFLPSLAYLRNTHFSADGDTLIWDSDGPWVREGVLALLDVESGELRTSRARRSSRADGGSVQTSSF